MSQTKAQLVDAVDGSIVAADLASNSVTTDKVVDAAITTDKTSFPVANRNLIINGAMQVAQRGLSSTSSGHHSVDRFQVEYSGTDEAPTQAQVDVSAGTTPYTNGFRKSYRITNGNQTGGVGASDRIRYRYKFEAQDIANSGWNFTSASSFVTLSFWIKSSVAQNFYGSFLTIDGSNQEYSFETGSLSADTWTKVTKTIPGNSNLTFDNNNENGLDFNLFAFLGTNNTGPTTMNQWAAFNNSARTPDQTSTWYTTNNATLEITGFQLEVGSVATDFEHKSFDEVRRQCYRYFQKVRGGVGCAGSSSQVNGVLIYEPMRSDPSVGKIGTTFQFGDMIDQGRSSSGTPTSFRNDGLHGHSSYALTGFSGMTTGEAMRDEGAGGDAAFALDAEL